MLISGSNLKKTFSERVLFENVSFHIDDNDKIGFVGSNGVGKTTLFKILIGSENYDEGELYKSKQLKIGYLDQYSCADSDKTIFDEVLEVFSHIISLEEELEDIRLRLEYETEDIESIISRQNQINEYLLANEGFYYKNKVRSTLIGLGFKEEELSTEVSKLSGGQKTRVELAKILLSDSNLLLLDEPTNHLDIESVEWLEDFLRSYKGAFVVISHDRYFLDKVTNKTFEIECSKLYSFNGSYTAYSAQKEIDSLTREREYENTMREISRLEDVIKQQRQWNREKNIKTAESKQKVVDKLKSTLVTPDEITDDIEFHFHAYEGGGNDVLDVKSISKRFDNKSVINNLSFDVVKGEKIFILGPNGCGKTTLLKMIIGELTQDEGVIKLGTDIHIGYYDQIQENLSSNKTVIDEVWDEYPHLTHTEIRNALAAFLFRGEDVFKEIGALSGGEKARVLLVKLILKKVNLLIMDEPTNHLDINSREALEKALSTYSGTMIMVSHDRYFINKLADRVIYLKETDCIKSIGGYDDFIERFSEELHSGSDIETKKKSAGEDYKQKKQREANKRKAVNRANKLEEEIARLESENETLSAELLSPDVSTDYVKAAEISDKISTNEENIATLLDEWEKLSLEIEEDNF